MIYIENAESGKTEGEPFKKAILEMLDGITDKKMLRRIYIIVRMAWEHS